MAAYSVTESGVLQWSSDEAANPRGVKLSADNQLGKEKHESSFNGRINYGNKPEPDRSEGAQGVEAGVYQLVSSHLRCGQPAGLFSCAEVGQGDGAG